MKPNHSTIGNEVAALSAAAGDADADVELLDEKVPLGMIVIAAYLAISALPSFIIAAVTIGIGQFLLDSTIVVALGAFSGLMGLAGLVIAYGLLRLRRWAHTALLAFLAIGVSLGALKAFLGDAISLGTGILKLVMLVYAAKRRDRYVDSDEKNEDNGDDEDNTSKNSQNDE